MLTQKEFNHIKESLNKSKKKVKESLKVAKKEIPQLWKEILYIFALLLSITIMVGNFFLSWELIKIFEINNILLRIVFFAFIFFNAEILSFIVMRIMNGRIKDWLENGKILEWRVEEWESRLKSIEGAINDIDLGLKTSLICLIPLGLIVIVLVVFKFL